MKRQVEALVGIHAKCAPTCSCLELKTSVKKTMDEFMNSAVCKINIYRKELTVSERWTGAITRHDAKRQRGIFMKRKAMPKQIIMYMKRNASSLGASFLQVLYTAGAKHGQNGTKTTTIV